jgi:hypothetical protein
MNRHTLREGQLPFDSWLAVHEPFLDARYDSWNSRHLLEGQEHPLLQQDPEEEGEADSNDHKSSR